MKIDKNILEDFIKIIKKCKGPIYLTDWEIDSDGEYNLLLDLKSETALYLGISCLLSEKGDWYEIHTTNREDESKFMEFLDSQVY